MNLATAVSALRLALSPVFFVLIFWATPGGKAEPIVIAALWLLFLVIELSDLFDGMIARSMDQASDFGKLFDPFADSVARLTYFLAYALAGLMPVWVLLLALYRDLWVSFVRTLVARKGTALGARLSGKIKAWVYAIAGGAGIAYLSAASLPALSSIIPFARIFMDACFVAVGLTAIWTALDYSMALRQDSGKASK